MLLKEWDWSRLPEPYWVAPSPEAHYLAHRWKAGSKLLDLGCGKGRNALYLAARGLKVFAADYSRSGVEATRKSALKSRLPARPVLSDMHFVPFRSGAFDCLLAYHVIYHTDWDGLRRTMGEIKRVLRPGGEACVTFISAEGLRSNRRFLRRVSGRTWAKRGGPERGVPHTYVDDADVAALLRPFRVIELRQVRQIFGKNGSWHYHALVRKR